MPREIKWPTQCHTAHRWPQWGIKASLLSTCLAISSFLHCLPYKQWWEDPGKILEIFKGRHDSCPKIWKGLSCSKGNRLYPPLYTKSIGGDYHRASFHSTSGGSLEPLSWARIDWGWRVRYSEMQSSDAPIGMWAVLDPFIYSVVKYIIIEQKTPL